MYVYVLYDASVVHCVRMCAGEDASEANRRAVTTHYTRYRAKSAHTGGGLLGTRRMTGIPWRIVCVCVRVLVLDDEHGSIRIILPYVYGLVCMLLNPNQTE